MASPTAFRSALKSQQGMTLVEIMVVIAILGTIMSVVAFSVVGKLDEANCEATKLTMKNADQALQLYSAKKKGKFPSTSDGLAAAKKYFNDGDVPVDAWGNELQYFSPGSHSDAPYELVSLGKDGVEGGDEANADIQSWNMDEACDW
ncbi:MAG: type II secretion system major pseudopilin GspG [Myxococcota bacterium]|nr:type II secretion system major pseudopilin GspG [Myxococcota bacterium]